MVPRHVPLALVVVIGACSLDWDTLDPRLGQGQTTSSSSAGSAGGPSSTGAGGAGGASSTSTTSSTTTSGSGGAGGRATDVFVDAFDRPDGPIGNDWIEKTADVYTIAGERVVKAQTATSYQDNMVYRPAAEDLRDVEIQLEFETLSANVAYPQIFVRAPSAAIASPNAYDGYLFYVEGSASSAVLGRQLGTPFVVTLESLSIDPPLTPGQTYRLRLSAQGTDPVHLEAYVEQLVSGSWTIIGAAQHDDAAPERITEVGTVGFAGNEPDTFVYDDFQRTPL